MKLMSESRCKQLKIVKLEIVKNAQAAAFAKDIAELGIYFMKK
jgi:hypothetical protein